MKGFLVALVSVAGLFFLIFGGAYWFQPYAVDVEKRQYDEIMANRTANTISGAEYTAAGGDHALASEQLKSIQKTDPLYPKAQALIKQYKPFLASDKARNEKEAKARQKANDEAVAREVREALKNGASIDHEAFDRLKMGESYDSVVAELGFPGDLKVESSVGNITDRVYTWKGREGIKIISCSFQNQRLVAKSQVGL